MTSFMKHLHDAINEPKYHFRNIVMGNDSTVSFRAWNTYVYSILNRVDQNLIIRKDLVPTAFDDVKEDCKLLCASYLGHMSETEFLTSNEPLNQDNPDNQHFYNLYFRSVSSSFSIVISKSSPFISKPTIEAIKRYNNLKDYLLMNVDYLGEMTRQEFYQQI